MVVAYHPEMAVLDGLLEALSPQVELLILVDNGGGRDFLMADPLLRSNIHYLDMQGNQGLGAALNRGFAIAQASGVECLVTFDQDSQVSADLIERLHAALKRGQAKDSRCVAVGPQFHDRRMAEKKPFPFYSSAGGKINAVYASSDGDGLVAADTLITSGMMVTVSAWRRGFTYNEDLFVDYTDTEWCFRVMNAGQTVYGCTDVEMGHALSEAPPVKILGLSFFVYSPVRRYFYFRNTVAVIRMAHTPWRWKLRLGQGLMLRFFMNLLIDTRRAESLRMMLRGIGHGLSNKLGGVR